MENIEKAIMDGLTELKAQVKASATKDEVMAIVEKAATKEELQAIAETATATKELADKLNEKLGQIKAGQESKEPKRSIEQAAIEAISEKAAEIKKLGAKESMRIQLKAVSVMDFANNFSTANVAISDLRPGIVGVPNRRLRVRNLLPTGTTDTANFVYVKETGGEGAPALWAGYQTVKEPIDRDFVETVAPVRTIAGKLDITKNMVDDLAGLQSFLQNRLTNMYLDKEDNVLLFGANNTAPNLQGITVAATGSVNGAARTIDKIVLTAATLKNSNHYANGIVVNPVTFAEMALNQATDKSYSYPVVFNAMTNQMTLAGIPVYEHQEIPITHFLIGDWTNGAQLIIREQPTVEVSYENNDNFEKNMLTIRVEGRIALPIYYPDAFAYGTKGSFSGS